jgi:tetratricopeptide (TPR) repeat protein
MFRKIYFSLLITTALFLTGSLSVFAQSSPVRGKVVLKKADGTTEPVVGATIEVFRTDIKGKLPAGKTDKKGVFNFAGFPLGRTYALSVSAPNIQPIVFPNIKSGMENITITVVAGDGRRLTEDEAREVLASPNTATSATAATAPTSSKKPAEDSAEVKKLREEEAKKIAEINSKNEKIKGSTEVIQKSLTEGNAAFTAKNFDVAIAKFDEGYKASPDFVGSAPVLLNNKAASLTSRAIVLYNENVKATETSQKVAGKAKVKQDFADAVDAYNNSLLVIKNSTGSTEVNAQKLAELKLQTLNGAESVLELMVKTDAVDDKKTEAARTLMQEYVATETDAAKKLKAQTTLGDVFRVAGDSDNAIIEYKKALAIAPDNADALAGLGLSLYNSGVLNDNNKAQMQEGLNYMSRFAEVAPANHPLKSDVAGLVEYLKTQEKLTPQKVSKTATKKKQ